MGILIPVMSFLIGCTSQKPALTASVITQPAKFSIGDTVLVWIRTKQAGAPVHVEEQPEKIADDGTVGPYKAKVAGLTPNEAAAKIRKALIMDLYGVEIDEVSVVKVQPKD